MSIKHFKLHGFLLVILMMFVPISNLAIEYNAGEMGHELIFSIPTGEKGIHYEGVGVPEMRKWGPPAFTIAPDAMGAGDL